MQHLGSGRWTEKVLGFGDWSCSCCIQSRWPFPKIGTGSVGWNSLMKLLVTLAVGDNRSHDSGTLPVLDQMGLGDSLCSRMHLRLEKLLGCYLLARHGRIAGRSDLPLWSRINLSF